MTDIIDALKEMTVKDQFGFIKDDVKEQVILEIQLLRTMIADFIHAWRWYQEDEYDREQPHDCIREMVDYMEKLGYKINHLGISRTKD